MSIENIVTSYSVKDVNVFMNLQLLVAKEIKSLNISPIQ